MSGEPGIGKTRFCDEVADQVRAAGLRVVAARCWSDGGAPPLWPWQPILGELCGRDAADLLASDVGTATIDPDRFARFAAITDQLAAACTREPVCLVIDDVHSADRGTLLLVRFVARTLARLPLALVLARRSREPAGDEAATQLLDEIEREGTPIVLRRFDWDEAEAFLAAHGLESLDRDVAEALLRVTDGNPLFLRRVAALGPPERGQALPSGVRVAIDQALSRLRPDTQRVLRTASVLGLTPSITEAAAVTRSRPVAVLDAVQGGVGAGLVTVGGADRFTFSHELVRSTLENAMEVADRLDAHARAASAIGGDEPAVPSDRLAQRAFHALAAAPRSAEDARLAVAACRAAARAMVNGFAYEQADAVLSAAVALFEPTNLGTPSGELLVEWAQAALLCGHMSEARTRFGQAATTAQREEDPVTFAEAALGLGGHWVDEHRQPVARARVLGLQRSARDKLPSRHEALHCRLNARLACEAVFAGGPIEAVHEALDAARLCGDPLAVAEALSLAHHALLRPEHIRTRLKLADEQIRVASEAGHGMLALVGLCWRTVDLFHLGDDRAYRALEDLRERANALASQHIRFVVGAIDVMLLIRQGRLDEAERESKDMYSLGEAIGEVDALSYFSAHLLTIRWIQDRDTELLETAVETAASPTLIEPEFAFRASAAVIAARAGRHDIARNTLDALAAEGLATLPRSVTWMTGMMGIASLAAELDDAAVARQAYDLLLPFADLPLMASLAMLCFGSTERYLGMAALTFGDEDLAIRHLEQAIASSGRLGNRPLVAITQAELAAALVRRDLPQDRVRAAELLDQAALQASRMGLTARAEGWRAELAAVDDSDHGAPARDGRDSRVADMRQGYIRRDGPRWIVGLEDHRVRLPDLVGLRYLAELLSRSGQPVTALALASSGAVQGDASRYELLDDEARAAYVARARELSQELAQAEANNDIVHIERLQAELDAIVDQLEAATGLGGRARSFNDNAERARTAVRKAIKRAIDAIDDASPAIAKTLHSTVSTGTTCTYTPDPRDPVVWSTGGNENLLPLD